MDESKQLGGLVAYREQRIWGHETIYVFGRYWVSYMNKYIYRFCLLTASTFGVEWVYYVVGIFATNNEQYRIQMAM